MNDILPAQVGRWQEIERVAREVFALHGYREIRTPVVEPYALYARGVGEATDIVNKEMYVFEDKGEEKLALRPEGTAGTVRAYIAALRRVPGALRGRPAGARRPGGRLPGQSAARPRPRLLRPHRLRVHQRRARIPVGGGRRRALRRPRRDARRPAHARDRVRHGRGTARAAAGGGRTVRCPRPAREVFFVSADEAGRREGLRRAAESARRRRLRPRRSRGKARPPVQAGRAGGDATRS